MALRDMGLAFVIGALILAALIGAGASKITGQGDHPIEQAAERVIYKITGMEVDFSPNNEEFQDEEFSCVGEDERGDTSEYQDTSAEGIQQAASK